MQLDTFIYVVIAIGLVILQIALIMAIFSIKTNTERSADNAVKQTKILNDIRMYACLQAEKNISTIEVVKIVSEKYKDTNSELTKPEVVTLSEYMEKYNDMRIYKINNVK